MKIDKTIIKETKYIAFFVAIFSLLMQAIFLIIGEWHWTMIFSNLWGAAVAMGNFFVMCLYIQKATNQEEKEARQTIKTSMSLRFSVLILLVGAGVLIFRKDLGWIGVVVPLVFPSFAVFFRSLIDKNK